MEKGIPAFWAIAVRALAFSSRAITTMPTGAPRPSLVTIGVQHRADKIFCICTSPHWVAWAGTGLSAQRRCNSASKSSWRGNTPVLMVRTPQPVAWPLRSMKSIAFRLEVNIAAGPILLRSNTLSGFCMWWYSSSQKAQSRFSTLSPDNCSSKPLNTRLALFWTMLFSIVSKAGSKLLFMSISPKLPIEPNDRANMSITLGPTPHLASGRYLSCFMGMG